MALVIKTGCLADAHLIRQLGGHELWDVTVKTGDRALAPTWELVWGYKGRTLTAEQYRARYLALLETRTAQYGPSWIERLLRAEGKVVVLACYCPPPPNFCHRHLLAAWLAEFARERGFTVELAGEVW